MVALSVLSHYSTYLSLSGRNYPFLQVTNNLASLTKKEGLQGGNHTPRE
jgi:hypothetical protein